MNAWMQDSANDAAFVLYLLLGVAGIFALAAVLEYFYKLWKETR